MFLKTFFFKGGPLQNRNFVVFYFLLLYFLVFYCVFLYFYCLFDPKISRKESIAKIFDPKILPF
jgi:hypothetical protein